jgi:hypothetical protein
MKIETLSQTEKALRVLQIVVLVLCVSVWALAVQNLLEDNKGSQLKASVRADVASNFITLTATQEELPASTRNEFVKAYKPTSTNGNLVIVTGNSEEFIVCAYNSESNFSVLDNNAVKVARADNITEDLGHYEMHGNQCAQVATLETLDENRTDGEPNF